VGGLKRWRTGKRAGLGKSQLDNLRINRTIQALKCLYSWERVVIKICKRKNISDLEIRLKSAKTALKCMDKAPRACLNSLAPYGK